MFIVDSSFSSHRMTLYQCYFFAFRIFSRSGPTEKKRFGDFFEGKKKNRIPGRRLALMSDIFEDSKKLNLSCGIRLSPKFRKVSRLKRS